MQRIGNLKERFLSFQNLYSAWRKAFRSTKTYESYKFTFTLEKGLFKLQEELRSGNYRPGDYRYFTIADPKCRTISVAPFKDRIVHHALISILEQVYERRFIYHSYATRRGKGTHKAIIQVQKYLRNNKWYLKMDIAKYFDSINHDKLYFLLSRKIKDNFILDLCRKIINIGGNGYCGLPIGNLTSQFWANVYLDHFDHFVKEKLRIGPYLRYMDDFCLFSGEKRKLKKMRIKIKDFLMNGLRLKPKERATLINTSVHGLPFLGVRVFPSMIRIRKENFKRSFEKLRKKEKKYHDGKIDYQNYISSMMSLLSSLQYWNSKLLLGNMLSKMNNNPRAPGCSKIFSNKHVF